MLKTHQKVIKSLLLLIGIFALSGCAMLREYAVGGVEEARKANDDMLAAGELLYCGTTMPALMRRFKTAEELRAWQGACMREYNLKMFPPTEKDEDP